MNSFSKYYNQPPETLDEKQIIHYLNYCINNKKLCRGTVNYINSTLKFFYVVTFERSWSDLRIPKLRYDKTLPQYLIKEEVRLLLESITYLKHKAIFSTMSSGSLRDSEVITLRISDIMSTEMKIRVRNGKRNNERYTLLSHKNLYILRLYCKKFGYKNYSPDNYLFVSRQKSIQIYLFCMLHYLIHNLFTTIGYFEKVLHELALICIISKYLSILLMNL